MICPRWLVQSSAAGVVGAALVAVPMWLSTSPADGGASGEWASSPPVVEPADGEVEEAIRQAGEAAGPADRPRMKVRVMRAVRVDPETREIRPAPRCMAPVEFPDDLDDEPSRSDAPQSVWEPGDAYEGDDDARTEMLRYDDALRR